LPEFWCVENLFSFRKMLFFAGKPQPVWPFVFIDEKNGV